MTLIEAFIRDEIYIDFGAGVLYGNDQCYVSFPCRFPTVGFQLMATNGLSQIADRIRKDLGFVPMHPMDEYTDDTCDNDGWYDFYVGINGYSESHMDSCIEFVVVNSNSPDDEERYSIDLTEEEQEAVFKCLDEQCHKYEGKSCEDLLAEAEKRMDEELAHE